MTLPLFFGGLASRFHHGGIKWRFVDAQRGRPRVFPERVKSTAMLQQATSEALSAWCRRREVSVTVAVVAALEAYCPAATEPGTRPHDAVLVKVQFRLTSALRQAVVDDAERIRCGYSRYVDAAVAAMCGRGTRHGLHDFRAR